MHNKVICYGEMWYYLGYWQVFIAVGLTMWVEVARVVRGQVMGVKEQQYVTAAKALGFTDLRIIFKVIKLV